MIDDKDLNTSSLKVPELKKQLKLRNLPTTGKKANLIERLDEYLSNALKNEGEESQEEPEKEPEIDNQDQNIEKDSNMQDWEIVSEKEEILSKKRVAESLPAVKVKRGKPDDAWNGAVDVESFYYEGENSFVAVAEAAERRAINNDDTFSEIIANNEPETNYTNVRIDGYIRPFRIRDAEDMLQKYGKISRFWMNDVRSLCIVSFSSSSEASHCAEDINGVIWPEGGNSLNTALISSEEAKKIMKGLVPIPPISTESESVKGEPIIPKDIAPITESKPQVESDNKNDEKTTVDILDKLFRKTEAQPALYWLPVLPNQPRPRSTENRERTREKYSPRLPYRRSQGSGSFMQRRRRW